MNRSQSLTCHAIATAVESVCQCRQNELLTHCQPQSQCNATLSSFGTALHCTLLCSGASAVGFGAFGAHGLRSSGNRDDRMLKAWDTAAQYHLMHSIALCLSSQTHAGALRWTPRLFTAGIILFSGSLYAMVLTDQRKLGAITPIGGIALIAAWTAMAFRL